MSSGEATTALDRPVTATDLKALVESGARAIEVNLDLAAQVNALRAENARMRGALRRVANDRPREPNEWLWTRFARVRKIAREALANG